MANFTEEIINYVWEKAEKVANNDPNIWRKDFAGAWIRRDQYGKTSNYGWEIDHLRPVSQGGTDAIGNLLPMHWENNRRKADNYPSFFSEVTALGVNNVKISKSWKVG
jgi:hypothetical protein